VIRKKRDMEKRSYSFKILFFSYTLFALPFFLTYGILAASHLASINFNNKDSNGWQALVICLFFYTPFFGLLFAGLNWVILTLGLKVYAFLERKFKRK